MFGQTDVLDAAPSFTVISGRQVDSVLTGDERRVIDIVADAYRTHGAGDTVNPPSYFLRFPDRPEARIIALPASLGGDNGVDGLKWISSFPANIHSGLPRASAVLTLNDPRTGYPRACMEASIISAARTAASAALAARVLSAGRPAPRRLGIVGTGLIARFTHRYLAAAEFDFAEIGLHDLNPEQANSFRDRYLANAAPGTPVTVHDTHSALIEASDLVVFATVSGEPYVTDLAAFTHHPLVLHVSLRDLAPEILLESVNVLDDVEHCLKANTSPHLVEQRLGHRDFIAGTLDDVLRGELTVPADQTVIFSPFGLGVLDLAVAGHVYAELSRTGQLVTVPDFFYELDRFSGRPARE